MIQKRRTTAEKRQIRKRLIEKQDRRCPICDLEIELDVKGKRVFVHEPADQILCQKCWSLVTHMDRKRGVILDRAIELVADYPGCTGLKS
jgi:hypothetical protein